MRWLILAIIFSGCLDARALKEKCERTCTALHADGSALNLSNSGCICISDLKLRHER